MIPSLRLDTHHLVEYSGDGANRNVSGSAGPSILNAEGWLALTSQLKRAGSRLAYA